MFIAGLPALCGHTTALYEEAVHPAFHAQVGRDSHVLPTGPSTRCRPRPRWSSSTGRSVRVEYMTPASVAHKNLHGALPRSALRGTHRGARPEHLLVGGHPLPQPTDSRSLVHFRRPAEISTNIPDVAHVTRLIAGPPVAVTHSDCFPVQLGQKLPELFPHGQCVRRPPADVVDLPGCDADLVHGTPQGSHEILHEQDVPHLLPVSIDCDRRPGPSRYDEVRKPALVLVPELPRAIDAAHAKHDGAKAIDARVVAHVLICRSLRASIRRVKVERAGFGDPIWQVAILVARILLYQRDVLHAAVHLVCGCEHHHRLTRALPRSLQHVQGAERVDLEVHPGILDRRGDGNLSSQMIDRVHILGCRLDRLGIADVTLDESQVTIGMLPLKPL